jgi:hypothetical protein
LRKKRDDRYDSAAHFASDLESLLGGEAPVHATQLGPLETLSLRSPHTPRRTSPPAPAPRPAETPGELYVVEEPEKRFPLRLVGGVALGVILVGSVALFLAQKAGGREGTPAATTAAANGNEAAASPPPGPTPMPAKISLPATTAPVLSMESSGLAARVGLDLRHPFATGALRVKVDDRVVFASSLNGMPMKVMGVVSGYDGRFGTDLVIPPGDHVIQIEVRSGTTAFVESLRVRLRSGESRRLLARVDKTLTLSLE